MAGIKDKTVTVDSLFALHEHNKETYITKTEYVTGLENFFSNGATVLSSYQYGDELPEAGTVGRIFFKKVKLHDYDINQDGIVSDEDGDMIAAHILGESVITDTETLQRIDVNKDGIVDSTDAEIVYNYVKS